MNAVMLVTIVVLCVQSPLQKETTFVLNIDGSPLHLSHTRSSFSAQNVLQKTITKYQLGCGRQDSKGIRVVHHFPVESVPIPPGATVSSAGFHLPPDEITICQEKHARTIALSTTTEDGGVWKLKRTDRVAP